MAFQRGLHPTQNLSAASVGPGVHEAPSALAERDDPAAKPAPPAPSACVKRGQSAASTAAAAVEHRKHSHDRYRIPASELRAGDILVDCTEFEPRYLRVRSLTREESALDVTFRDDLTTRISRFEMVTVVRGYMTPYIREDGSIDHVRWAEDHCEDMSGADL